MKAIYQLEVLEAVSLTVSQYLTIDERVNQGSPVVRWSGTSKYKDVLDDSFFGDMIILSKF